MNRKNRFISLSLVASLCFLGWGGDTDPNTSSQSGKTSGSIPPEPNESEWIEKIKNLDPHIISLLKSPELTIQALNFIKETDLYILNTAIQRRYPFDSDGLPSLEKFLEIGYMLNSLKDKFPQGFSAEALEYIDEIFKAQEEKLNLLNFEQIINYLNIDVFEKQSRLSKIDSLIKESDLLIGTFTIKLNTCFSSPKNN